MQKLGKGHVVRSPGGVGCCVDRFEGVVDLGSVGWQPWEPVAMDEAGLRCAVAEC